MNKTLGLQLVIYSLLLVGLSYLTQHLAPVLTRPTFITGLIGGALCLVWGVRAMLGRRGKVLPMLTLVPVSFVLLSQTVMSWSGRVEGMPGQRLAAVVVTLLFVISIGMLMRTAYAGVVFDGQPGGLTTDDGVRTQSTGKQSEPRNANKRG